MSLPSCGDAPARPGEMKVRLHVDKLEGEFSEANNDISTYVTVNKEGLSVLYVEGIYRFEARFIRDALRVRPTVRLTAQPPMAIALTRIVAQRASLVGRAATQTAMPSWTRPDSRKATPRDVASLQCAATIDRCVHGAVTHPSVVRTNTWVASYGS